MSEEVGRKFELVDKQEQVEINWFEFEVPEKKRLYMFPDGRAIVFYDVKRIEIRPSGKHRIETVEGRKAVVAPGWLYVEIESDNWNF